METRFIVRTVIFSSCLLFVFYTVFFGDLGLNKYLRAKHEVSIERKQLNALVVKVDKLERKIKKMKNKSLHLEKCAREDLQMGDKGETVYLM